MAPYFYVTPECSICGKGNQNGPIEADNEDIVRTWGEVRSADTYCATHGLKYFRENGYWIIQVKEISEDEAKADPHTWRLEESDI